MCTREKKMSRNCGIKVLNHAMTGVEGTDNCQKFVDILGLRTVFPLFMKTPKHGRAGPPPEEIEGAWHDVIVCCLFSTPEQRAFRIVGCLSESIIGLLTL